MGVEVDLVVGVEAEVDLAVADLAAEHVAKLKAGNQLSEMRIVQTTQVVLVGGGVLARVAPRVALSKVHK